MDTKMKRQKVETQNEVKLEGQKNGKTERQKE